MSTGGSRGVELPITPDVASIPSPLLSALLRTGTDDARADLVFLLL